MRAKDVMSDGVVSLRSDATLYEAAEMLVNCRVSAMPVLDKDNFMIGIVSEADLLQRPEVGAGPVAAGLLSQLADDAMATAVLEYAHSHNVVDVMSKNVVTADENASLAEVCELMTKHRIKRVPILREGSVVGIASRVDMLKALLSPGRQVGLVRPPADAPSSADELLRRGVMAALEGQSWSVARHSEVVVKDGVAHLWGMVTAETMRQAYQTTAEKVPGIHSVENHMHILR